MNDKHHLISNRGAQDLSRPAVFIKNKKVNQMQGEQNCRSAKKKVLPNKVSK